MPKRLSIGLLWIGLLLLANCNGRETPLPTPALPAVTAEATPTAASWPATVQANPTAVPLPAKATPTVASLSPSNTPALSLTADPLEDLESIDTVLQEIDNQVCQEALETRAEIEELLQQGQDVADLAAAIDELIAELEGCSLTPTPTP